MREERREQMVFVLVRWTFPPKLPGVLKSCNIPLCNRPSGIYIFTGFSEKASLDWSIFHKVFLFSCVVHIKVERGRRPYIFTATLNAFYLKLLLYREELNDLHFFYARLITSTLRILFLSMVIMFFFFLLLLNNYE